MTILIRAVKNQKGSVLMTVLLVMLILSIIAIGTIQASANNIIQAKKVDNYERLYYGAESAANTAAETLRKEVAQYYGQMAQQALDDINGGVVNLINYYNLKTLFPASVAANTRAAYQEPDLTNYEYGSITTATTFSDGIRISELGVNPPTYRFTITSTATEGSEARTFQTNVDITVEDVDIVQDISNPPNLEVGLAVGGTLSLVQTGIDFDIYGDASLGGIYVKGGGIIPSDFESDNDDYVQPDITDQIEWHLDFGTMLSHFRSNILASFPSGYNAPIRPTHTDNISYNNSNNIKITNSPNPVKIQGPENGNVSVEPKNSDISLGAMIAGHQHVSLEGRKYWGFFWNTFEITSGTLWADSNLSLEDHVEISASAAYPVLLYSGADMDIDGDVTQARLYSQGSMDVDGEYDNSTEVYNYAGGNMYLTNMDNDVSNTTLYCQGNAVLYGDYTDCVIYCNGSITLGAGTLSSSKTKLTRCTIYAGGDINIKNRTELYNCTIYGNDDLFYETDYNTDLVDWSYASDCLIVVRDDASIGQDTNDCYVLVGGDMTLKGVESDNSLYYADGDMSFTGLLDGNYVNGVFYCNGDAEINANAYSLLQMSGGQIICKGDMDVKRIEWIFFVEYDHYITYDGALVASLLDASNLYDNLGIIPDVMGPPVAVFPQTDEVYITETTSES